MSASASSPPAVFKLRCRFCSKFRHPREFIGAPDTGYCWHCYEWHAKALAAFAGTPPDGCQACGRSFAELEALAGADVRFGFHAKDGIYQVLGIACGCSDRYERKRLDLYAGTPYGQLKKLAGAK